MKTAVSKNLKLDFIVTINSIMINKFYKIEKE